MRQNRQVEQEEQSGAPEWMVTFSDCMTLLLTFFVLLLSFSSFSDKSDAKKCIVMYEGQNSISDQSRDDHEALTEMPVVSHTKSIENGSEKPTLEEGAANNLSSKSDIDFYGKNVFLVPSGDIFWAKGSTVSKNGSKILDKMATFFKCVPAKIVVSENGPGQEGLKRAWSIVEYFRSQGMDRNLFSITSRSTLPQVAMGKTKPNKRTVEVVLLQRSICN